MNRAAKPINGDDYRTNGAVAPDIKYQNRRGKAHVADFINTLSDIPGWSGIAGKAGEKLGNGVCGYRPTRKY